MSTLQHKGNNSDSLLETDSGFQAQIDLIGQLYRFKSSEIVTNYLSARRYIVPVLVEAKGKIAEIFGQQTTVVLNVVDFHDGPDSRQLFGEIETRLLPEEAYSLLTRFDDEWWLDASETAHHEVNFALEYV
jgi:hypothetical protein